MTGGAERADPTPGLRERKKQRTREHIAATARRLFAERGFERVTVAEVARAAEVAEATVFNYFPTKEDLVYHRFEAFERELLQALRERPAGESIPAAFGRWLASQPGMLRESPISGEFRALTRVIAESPALQRREAEVFARFTDDLAALIAEETGAERGDVRPWVAANALVGLHRALVALARRRVLEGAENPSLSREVDAQARRAFAALAPALAALYDGT